MFSKSSDSRFVIVIPTLNAADHWSDLISSIRTQSVCPDDIVIVDSQSTDQTVSLARRDGLNLIQIKREEFNHGGTRQLAVDLATEVDKIVFLTQDAILARPDSLQNLLRAFDNSSVGAAFGRQLPSETASPIAAHARIFNYPMESSLKLPENYKDFGFKAIFLSNSFAAYRKTALNGVGGFPKHTILGEDTVTAARLIKGGWGIAYVAEAQVFHSHNYTFIQEFRRYFDIGVLHSREAWLLTDFGEPGGDGIKFVLSETKHLCVRDPVLIPAAMLRTALKMLGYRLGRREEKLSQNLKCRLSMNRQYWTSNLPLASYRHSA